MFRTWREARNEEGFTLIELLVVVIIIGILAAIAIPAFLNQRERAWQSEVTSAVRNAALDIEAEATVVGGVYPGQAAGQVIAQTWVDDNVNTATGLPIAVVWYQAYNDAGAVATGTDVVTGFRLCMEHAQISEDHNVSYFGASEGNGVQGFVRGTTCPAAP